MSKKGLIVNLTPKEVFRIVKNEINGDLIHEEIHNFDNEKIIGTLIFEKYFFRVNNRVALIVIVDDLKDKTDVRIISTASSEGILFSFDWGASDSFISSVERVLKDNIVSVYLEE